MNLKKRYNAIKAIVILSVFTIICSGTAYSQDPGGSPDGPPPAVPFDDYLHLILIAVGVVVAIFSIRRMQLRVKQS